MNSSKNSAASARCKQQPAQAAQASLADQPVAPQLQPLQCQVLARIAVPPAAKRSQQMCACCEQLRTQLQPWQAEVSNAQQLLDACECHVTAAAREHSATYSELEHALSQCNVALEATALSTVVVQMVRKRNVTLGWNLRVYPVRHAGLGQVLRRAAAVTRNVHFFRSLRS